MDRFRIVAWSILHLRLMGAVHCRHKLALSGGWVCVCVPAEPFAGQPVMVRDSASAERCRVKDPPQEPGSDVCSLWVGPSRCVFACIVNMWGGCSAHAVAVAYFQSICRYGVHGCITISAHAVHTFVSAIFAIGVAGGCLWE
jgi:hypothetical protein